VMGVNYYPHLSTSEFVAGSSVTPQPLREDGLAGLEHVIGAFAKRYDRPVFLTETSMVGDHETRIEWLDASLDLLLRLRDRGLDVVGYTWWPLFHHVDWVYREASGPVQEHLVPMGMYDLRPNEVGVFERVSTPVVERFRERAAALA
jgi:beta-glucosidase